VTAIAPSEFDRLSVYLSELGAPAVAWYKTPCFERRLATRLRSRGCSVADYLGILDREPAERERLLSALVVGVTSFFRNPPAWLRLAELLAARPRGTAPFRAWSAGCATGEEAYSLAMLLASLEAKGVASVEGWQVLGSDVDERGLAVARNGAYSPRAAKDIAAVLPVHPGEVSADRFQVDPSIAARVRFEREDLAYSGRVASADLVLCRNVLIYFGETGQARVLESLVRAIRPGGWLMLGKAELAAHSISAIGPLDSRERIYRRVA
jgi:chemotaxis methyl-accepting protein methylase